MSKLLFNPAEVAEILGVSRPYVYELMNRTLDPLPSFTLGRCRKISKAELELWIARQGNANDEK